jgi:hypothetical protein
MAAFTPLARREEERLVCHQLFARFSTRHSIVFRERLLRDEVIVTKSIFEEKASDDVDTRF